MNAGYKLVEHDTQRVNVHQWRRSFLLDLFRRHVPRRTANPGVDVGRVLFSDSKIRQISVLIAVKQDVLRLHIVMDDAVAMGQVQRRSYVIEDRKNLVTGKATLVHAVPQAAGAQIAHHKISPVGIAPIVEQRNDMRVLEPGYQLRFIFEMLDELASVGMYRQNRLDGYFAAHRELSSSVHDSESALSQPLNELIALEGCSCSLNLSMLHLHSR